MNPADVLDHRADLLVRLENPLVRKAWTGHIEMDLGIDQPLSWIGSAGGDRARQIIRASAAGSVATLTDAVRDAEAFYVTADLVQLVVYASSQLDDLDRLTREVMPTRSGIVRFEGGIPFRDVRGQMLKISWIVWGPAAWVAKKRFDSQEPEEGTGLWMFNDHRDEPDSVYESIRREYRDTDDTIDRVIGRWGMVGTEVLVENERLGPAWVMADEDKVTHLKEQGVVPVEFTNIKRLIHAFWLLLGQTVTKAEDAHIDRARRKRADRRQIPPRVSVISLRHVESKRAEGESLVEWSHRWMVRGHWHWYHCGPDHPLAVEVEEGRYMCRLWLAPFVKGPADKPLVITDKVYNLRR